MEGRKEGMTGGVKSKLPFLLTLYISIFTPLLSLLLFNAHVTLFNSKGNRKKTRRRQRALCPFGFDALHFRSVVFPQPLGPRSPYTHLQASGRKRERERERGKVSGGKRNENALVPPPLSLFQHTHTHCVSNGHTQIDTHTHIHHTQCVRLRKEREGERAGPYPTGTVMSSSRRTSTRFDL